MSEVYEFLSRLFEELNKASIQYCVLRNWERLPNTVGNDVDLWVAGEDAVTFENILYAIADELGWRLIGRHYRLGFSGDGHYRFVSPSLNTYLEIDAYRYLSWKGFCYADEVLLRQHVKSHEKGFPILALGAEAATLVMKELLFEGEIRPKYWERIPEHAKIDENRFIGTLSPIVGPKKAVKIHILAVLSSWTQLKAYRRRIIIALVLRSMIRKPLLTMRLCVRHFYLRAMERIRPQAGFFLVLIGPDGAGKTTTGKALLKSRLVTRLFSSGLYLYRRFPLFPELKTFLPSFLRQRLSQSPDFAPGTGIHQMRPAGIVRCVLYLLYYGLEYFLGRVWLWKVARCGNRIVVFDRYWHEFVFQDWYKRCPRVLLRLLERVSAKPDALVFLDVTPEVAYERKREKTLAEIERLHRLGKEIVIRSQNGYCIKANEINQSVRGLEEIIVERLAERARLALRRRMG